MHQSGPLRLHYPSVFAHHPRVAAAQSTRHGGFSRAPFHGLNLGLHTGDDPEVVQENRRHFFAALGFTPDQIAGSRQVHGAEVLQVEAPGYFDGYDALITNRARILLTVTIADCTPILIFDPVRSAVAAIHAGWKGTISEICSKALAAMQAAYETRPEDCLAYIGACIDECDFAVDADVADYFSGAYKHWDEAKGKFFVDLKAANHDQLLRMGVPAQHIQVSPFSTYTHYQDFFSHRYEKGNTGRMLAAIGLRW